MAQHKICPECQKISHQSKGAARQHIGGILRHKVPNMHAMTPYKCPVGYGWHIGRNHEVLMINWKKGRTINLDRREVHVARTNMRKTRAGDHTETRTVSSVRTESES